MNLSSGNISVRPRFVYDMNMTDVYHMVWKEMKKYVKYILFEFIQ